LVGTDLQGKRLSRLPWKPLQLKEVAGMRSESLADIKSEWVAGMTSELLAGLDRNLQHAFETGAELRQGLARWIGYYNTDRTHSALAGQTPNERYHQNAPTPHPGHALDAVSITKQAA